MATGVTGRELAFLLGGLGAGGGVGYFVAKKHLETKYDDFALESIREVREHYEAKIIAAEPKPALKDLVKDLGYTSDNEVAEAEAEVSVVPYNYGKAQIVSPSLAEGTLERNIFDETPPWDYKVEIDKRDPTQPYVIHKDEFDELEEHEQATFTYFAGDDVLCDERDAVVDNRDAMIGDENLERFGHGSEDPNVVYIRNETLGMDFEINKSDGLFAQEVHGFTPEDLQHSAMRRRPRRDYDD